jgi:hypothetical protein
MILGPVTNTFMFTKSFNPEPAATAGAPYLERPDSSR